ncbi:PREDICTED: double-stranded RNA-binding protein 2-like [Nelumbo nucifera]|uniref:Double-stranded RNA-binding protein 2-like n=1 Tax=Nelumbo nucifera TaxID=4432 RepID=A0A1U7Z3W6_NELNU|nr:PREDICTED: double-stranded RNA-binding protein 2-like [Nelumbo nucifera]XP_010241443.1 PREDICTED: double-stranded RNA-binding protein 2-like [Nelumbo nucifera]XP_010241451.1 PREDICTED: double-stranded RNA-binding protein 2-like [Nelumbo nucifera]
MYKNQLQELAQRSCFNLPSYACIREGPDHAPRFKATVNFNGEIFESPTFCTTLRQAEHAAAEVALNTLSKRGPSRSLAAKVLDETGVYKNLLQETAHRAGLNLPVYTTVRSGPGHVPVFSCTVELAGMSFTGEPAKTKKQAQKNAAMAAWSALKQLSHVGSSSSASSPSLESEGNEEQEQVIVARALASLLPADASKSTQNDRQRRRRKSAPPVRRNMHPPSGGVSLFPVHYQNWAYSNFAPEVYRIWQQEQASQQQSRLLTLPVALTPPPGPQILPFIQSMFGPDHRQYFPAREQEATQSFPALAMSSSGPSLHFSNPLSPVPIRRSQVTVQEIKEEKTQKDEERLHGDMDTDGHKINIGSNSPGFSSFDAPKPPASGDSRTDQATPEKPEEDDKQNNLGSESGLGHSVKAEGSNSEPFGWGSRESAMDIRFRHRAANPGSVEFGLRHPHGFDSAKSNPRPHHSPRAGSPVMTRSYISPSSAAPIMIRTGGHVSSVSPQPESLNVRMPAPVKIRTSIPACSARSRPEGMMYGGPSVNFMAPAVQIRSVIPVCSAPPARKMPEPSGQEGLPQGGEKIAKESEDVAAASSELGKLRI